MILVLAPSGHPLRDLLPDALRQAAVDLPVQCFGPEDSGSLGVVLRTRGKELSGTVEWEGGQVEWRELRGAWCAMESAPPQGSPMELLLQGLDLAPLPVVGRPRVVETLTSSLQVDRAAKAAGLGHPPRRWVAANSSAQAVGSPESVGSPKLLRVWCGGREIHGAPDSLRPWLGSLQQFTSDLDVLWARVDLELLPGEPPCVHAVSQQAPGVHQLAELRDEQRAAFLAVMERLQRGHLRAVGR